MADSKLQTIMHATDTFDNIIMSLNTSKHATARYMWHAKNSTVYRNIEEM